MPYINNSAFLSQLSYGMTDISIINLNPITLDSVKAFRLELTGKLYYYGEMHMVGYFYDTKYSGYQLMLIYSDSERTKYEPIINKIIDSTIKSIERNQDAFPFFFVLLGSLLKQRQHGAFAVSHMLTAGAILTDGCQHIAQEFELIRNERIYFGEIICIFI